MLKWGITLSHRSARSSAFSSAPVPSRGDSASMPPRGSSGIVSYAILKAVARSHGRAPWGTLRWFAVPGLSRNTSRAHWASLPSGLVRTGVSSGGPWVHVLFFSRGHCTFPDSQGRYLKQRALYGCHTDVLHFLLQYSCCAM